MAEVPVHRYRATVSWQGSTGVGYDHFDRRHRVSGVPTTDWSTLSGDPAFGGDADVPNPELLLLVAAASCQLLSFLAVAARARLDVIAYEDHAEAVMPEADLPVRVTEIRLRPRITLRGTTTEDRLRHLVDVGHRECFIANSARSEIVIEPLFVRA